MFGIFVLLGGCYKPSGYNDNFISYSSYNIDKKLGGYTQKGILVVQDYPVVDDSEIDKNVDDLEDCLGVNINRSWFGVYIPNDWYISECTGEQKLPVAAPPDGCRAKGWDVPLYCEWLSRPTDECPCVCTWRATIQDNFWIVTTPNLKLFKAELARLVTSTTNVWEHEEIKQCLTR